MDITTFLSTFPEFGNVTTFPTSKITFWLGLAITQLNESRWGTLYSYGIALLTAHYLVIDARNNGVGDLPTMLPVLPGAVNGIDKGMKTDVEAYSVDSSSLITKGAGLYNTTTYGITFYQLAKWKGAGPLSALANQVWEH